MQGCSNRLRIGRQPFNFHLHEFVTCGSTTHTGDGGSKHTPHKNTTMQLYSRSRICQGVKQFKTHTCKSGVIEFPCFVKQLIFAFNFVLCHWTELNWVGVRSRLQELHNLRCLNRTGAHRSCVCLCLPVVQGSPGPKTKRVTTVTTTCEKGRMIDKYISFDLINSIIYWNSRNQTQVHPSAFAWIQAQLSHYTRC